MTIDKLINVNVKAHYDAKQSAAAEQRFVWSYKVIIENKSSHIIQLLGRFWHVTDLTGHVDTVRGLGVIGLQPIIKPGRNFTYTSFCQLATPQGTMEGHYDAQDLEDKQFTIAIPKFVLSAPSSLLKAFRAILH